MSLSSFLSANPRITGTLSIEVEFLFFSRTRTTNFNNNPIFIPFSASSLPDIITGNSGNNTLNGNSTTFSDSVNIPPFQVTVRYPTLTGTGSDTFSVDLDPFSVTNTPNDFLAGFGGSDFLRGFGGQDVLIGDGLTPNENGLDGVDTLDGGDGEDVIIGGGSGDNISGGNNNDFILGDYFLGLTNASIPINLNRVVFTRNNASIGDLELLGFIPLGSASYDANISARFGPESITLGSGNEGNDTISGGNGDDTIISDRGNDFVNGDAGNDIVIGAANNDTVNGGNGNDVLFGDSFAPNFAGLDGIDSLDGGSGDDVIVAGGLNDIARGGDGDDVLLGDYFLGLVNASIPINATIQVPDNIPLDNNDPFTLINIQLLNTSLPIGSGNEGNDTLFGGNGNDIVIGDRGNDLLFGDAGDDFILGGADADTATGGLGDDVLIGDLLAPNAYGADGIDNLNGGAGADVIIGGGLGDLIDGGADNDFILGDYLFGLPVTSPINIPLSGEEIELELPDINIPIGSGNEGNDIIDAGAGDDIVIADKGNDLVEGRSGNDVLIGGGDDDTITGGDGDDIITGDYLLPQDTVITLPSEVIESLGEFLTLPESGELTIDIGPAGDDLLEGGAGNDIISGDDGNDTITYENDPGAVNVSLGSLFNPGLGTATDGYGDFDVLLSIENVIGSTFNDQITGDSVNNIIEGRAGNDTIAGGAGDDELYGEEGDDVISGDEGDDFIVGGTGGDFINGGAGIDTSSYRESDIAVVVDLDVLFGVGFGSSGDARGDTLINIENLEGSQFSDRLIGNGVNNQIDGLRGDDQIFGEGGNDTLNGQTGSDIINGGDGDDKILGESGMDVLFGEAGDDHIYGGENFDELDGGLGNDRIFGDEGNDRIFGGEGDDQLFGGNGNDTVSGNAGVDYLAGGLGADSLLGQDGNDVLEGDKGNDTLRGGAGNDVIEGGEGIDHLFGNGGKDLFVFAGDPLIRDDNPGLQSFLVAELDAHQIKDIINDEQPEVPFLAPGVIDTIFDYEVGQDQIGLKDGLTFEDLIIIGVASDSSNSSNLNSSLIYFTSNFKQFSPLVEVLNVTPDELTEANFKVV